MGPKSKTGVYLSKTAVILFTLLFAGLLVGFTTLATLYARSRIDYGNRTHDEELNQESTTKGYILASTITPTVPEIWGSHRLPQTLAPINYQLELWPRLEPDDNDNYLFTGEINITFTCKQETDLIVLHSEKLNNSGVELNVVTDGETDVPQVLDILNSDVYSYMIIQLSKTLKEGSFYVLRIRFSGYMSTGRRLGLFVSHYTEDGQDMTLAVSQLEPTHARSVFPCFDEPAMKATFDIRIVHLFKYVVLSNMAAVGVSEIEDNNGTLWNVTTFKRTPRMSTYIVAFMVCEFDYIESRENGIELRMWARKSAVRSGEVDYALNVTGPILKHLEELLNVSYPLSKIDIVAVPEFFPGAMENWGLLLFMEDALFYNPNIHFSDSKVSICKIIAHELGHQWFGNLVTMNWWNFIWLNEGLSTYIESTIPSEVEPQLYVEDKLVIHDLQRMLLTDSIQMSHSLAVKEKDVETPTQIMGLFDLVTYSKGSSITKMTAKFLTEKVFRKGLMTYLQAFSYMNVDQDDLWKHWQMAANSQSELQLPTSVKRIMDSWTLQPGFPVISLNTSTGTITQEPCALPTENQTSNETCFSFTWYVPIQWMKNGSLQPLKWLDAKMSVFPEMAITSEDDWILLNVDVSGYYRVIYDEQNMERLHHQMMKDPNVIPVNNRAQIIDDAFRLMLAGYVDVEVALSTTKYLSREKDFVVWSKAIEILNSYLDSVISSNMYGLYKRYMLKTFTPIYNYYMDLIDGDLLNVREDDSYLQLSVQKSMEIACKFGHKGCLQHASKLYAQWMKNSTTNMFPFYIREDIYCFGIAAGEEREWEFAWKKLQEQNQIDLIRPLSCTKEPWLLKRYLNHLLDASSVVSERISSILRQILKNIIGEPLVWNFIQENMEIFQ
uniref:Aminopeptidase n=1 Tax=Lepisosteus oculatus TaxID=7918 RepID=W5MR21_LEPOC